MACTSPLPAWITYNLDGSIKYKVSKSIAPQNADGSFADKYIFVPCGHCMSCRLAKAREWSNRCMMEAKYHDQSLFLTLTYDDEHLPKDSTIVFDEETGEYKAEIHSLVKKDLTDFLKRLRYYLGYPIRYIACGEYGGKTYRPHFHLIVFGLNLEDLQILKRNYRGDIYYTSPTIAKVWKYGFHIIGDVTPESAGYVARYTTKKLLGKDAKLYEKYNIVPPYLVMSRRPGIGKEYLDDNRDYIYNYDNIILSNDDGSSTISVPRYFRKRMEIEDGERYERYAEIRENKLLELNLVEVYDEELDIKKVKEKWSEFDTLDSILYNKLGKIKERSAV